MGSKKRGLNLPITRPPGGSMEEKMKQALGGNRTHRASIGLSPLVRVKHLLRDYRNQACIVVWLAAYIAILHVNPKLFR
jgi:hypothetical protein